MLVILHPNCDESGADFIATQNYLQQLPGIEIREHIVQGQQQKLTELYLIGDTEKLSIEDIESLPAVERAFRISQEYRILGRHQDDDRSTGFEYNGVRFDQDNLNIFAGLCAVDNRKHVETMMQAVQSHGLTCTRMGAYKPRTTHTPSRDMANPAYPMSSNWQGVTASRSLPWKSPTRHTLKKLKKALSKQVNPPA